MIVHIFLEHYSITGTILKIREHSWIVVVNISERKKEPTTKPLVCHIYHPITSRSCSFQTTRSILKIFTLQNSRSEIKQHKNRSSNYQNIPLLYLRSRSVFIFFSPDKAVSYVNIYTRHWIKDEFSMSYIGFPLVLFNFRPKDIILTDVIKIQNWKLIKSVLDYHMVLC